MESKNTNHKPVESLLEFEVFTGFLVSSFESSLTESPK